MPEYKIISRQLGIPEYVSATFTAATDSEACSRFQEKLASPSLVGMHSCLTRADGASVDTSSVAPPNLIRNAR